MRQRVSEVEANQLSVRLELQADCFAGISETTPTGTGMIEPGDFAEGMRRRVRHRRRPPAAQCRAHGHPGFLHAWHVRAAAALARPRNRDRLLRRLRHLQGGRPLIVHTHPVPQAFAAPRGRQGRGLPGRRTRNRSAIPRLLGKGREAHRLVSLPDANQGRLLRPGGLPHPLVRGRRAQRLRQLPRPPAREARRQDRDPLGGRRPGRLAPRQLSRAARSASAASATRCASSACGRATASRSTCR